MIQINLEKNVPRTNYLTGELIPFTLKYANPSTTEDAVNLVITDELHSTLDYVSHVQSPDVESVLITTEQDKTLVRFVMKSPLPAGSTGIIQLNTRFTPYATPAYVDGERNSVTNIIKAVGDNVTLTESNAVTITPVNLSPNWSVTKEKILPEADPTLESAVTYRLNVYGNQNQTGAVNLTNIRVTDTLPAEATFVEASHNGEVVDGTVIWELPLLSPGQSFRPTVTVHYQNSNLIESDSVTNQVSVVATPLSVSEQTKTATYTHGFAPITPAIDNISKYTRTSNDKYSVGQVATYNIAGILNNGNTPLDQFIVSDAIPEYVRLESLELGNFENGTYELNLYYETNESQILRLWPGSPFVDFTNDSLNVSDLPLSPTEFVTRIEYQLTSSEEFVIGFNQTSPIRLHTRVLTTPTLPYTLNNTVTVEATKIGFEPVLKTAQCSITVISPVPWIQGTKKATNNQGDVSPNEFIEFQLTIKNHRYATGDLVDSRFVDVLPPQFKNAVITSIDTSRADLVQTPIEVSLDKTVILDGVTYQSIQADIFGTLEQNDRVVIKYQVQVDEAALVGNVYNDLYVGTQDPTQSYQNTNITTQTFNEIDTTRWIKYTQRTYVNFVGALSSVKWLKGELDSDYSKYPEFGQTLPGGKADYRLIVSNNNANGPISNIVLIDVFPRVGDTGVIDPNPRDSKWQPYLVNEMTGLNGSALPESAVIYYSTSEVLSYTELENPQNNPNPSDGWILTPPQDITSVKAIKITFGDYQLEPGEELVVEWQMRAPVNAVINEIAWNSFGYTATFPSVNGPTAFLASEPIKVGFLVEPYPANTAIISQSVWIDDIVDGLISNFEHGLNGVEIKLYNASNQALLGFTRTGDNLTNEAGFSQFPNISPGNYYLTYTYPRYYELTDTFVGDDDTINSWVISSSRVESMDLDYAAYTVRTPSFTITSNEVFHRNLGLYERASISGTVFFDQNLSGVLTNNPILSDVQVSLLDEFEQPVLDNLGEPLVVVTDQIGHYTFANLLPGRYILSVQNPSVEFYNFTAYKKGNDESVYNVFTSEGKTELLELKSGQDLVHQNAGLYEVFGRISGFVWNDINRDGLFNEAELKMYNVEVLLLDDQDNQLNSVSTSIAGNYLFSDLTLGVYKIKVTRLTDYIFTRYETGDDDEINSKVFPRTGETAFINLTKGQPDATFMNAGLYFNETATINGYVFVDPKLFPSEEKVIEARTNVLVSLYDNDGLVSTTRTDATGFYEFNSLDPKPYTVIYQIGNDDPMAISYCFARTDL